MNLAELMNTNFETLNPTETILKAIFLFRTTKSQSLPVVADEKLVGIVTRANVFDALLSGHSVSESIEKIFRRNILKLKANLSYDQVNKVIEDNSSVGGAVVVDDCDHVIGLFGKAEMITGSLKHERFLNAQLQAIYDTIDNGLILIDVNGQIMSINSTAQEVFGLEPEKVVGRRHPSRDASPRCHRTCSFPASGGPNAIP